MSSRMHIRIGVVVATSALALAALGSASAAPARKAVAVNIAGPTHLDTVVSPFVLQDVGTVSGSPVGSGDITLIYTLMPKRGVAVTTFTITNANGTVTGKAVSKYTVNTVTLSFTGAGRLTGGTGKYAGITSGPLQFNALHSVTGKKEAISFVGRATKPA